MMVSTDTTRIEQQWLVDARDERPGASSSNSATAPPHGLTLFYKILLANVAIVVLGAVAGTWITIIVVRREADERYFPLVAVFAFGGIVLSLVVNFLALRAAFRPLSRLQQAALSV